MNDTVLVQLSELETVRMALVCLTNMLSKNVKRRHGDSTRVTDVTWKRCSRISHVCAGPGTWTQADLTWVEPRWLECKQYMKRTPWLLVVTIRRTGQWHWRRTGGIKNGRFSLSPSRWPRGLSHAPSSFARTLGSWVRIPLKAWMSVLCAFILCLCCSVCRYKPCEGLIPRQRSPTDCV
jgi:hypothetical protein